MTAFLCWRRGLEAQLLLLLLPLTCSLQLASAVQFKVGVLHAPPFAMVEEKDNNMISYSGFQIDMLERLKIFASQDGVDLQIDMSPAPSNYGKAFNLVANDCNTTGNENLLEDCQQFDMIIGDFYCNADRYTRADFSPSWLKTTMTTIKYTNKPQGAEDFTTLRDAEKAGATVCVPAGTYLSTVVMEKFPQASFIECNAAKDECAQLLKEGKCVLFADDELLLHYKATTDPYLEVTRESFNTQYLVWPIREDFPAFSSKLLKKWMYRAVQNATLDDLYFQYFKQQLCPHGTAGPNCELPCDANHGTADARGVCVCKSSKWTGYDCSTEVMEELNLLPTAVVSTCYGLAGINFALVAACALWLLKNRQSSQVRLAQRTSLSMILVGCAISTSTIFALAQEDQGDGPVYSCAAVPWLCSVGFCLTFGALFARIKRIYTVMNSAAKMKRVKISSKETVLTVVLVLGIDVAILTVWTVVDPLHWTRATTSADLFGEPLESEGYCKSDHWRIFGSIIASYHIVLMMVACYMCYLARAIPDRISNSKYVAIAMFSNLQILVIAIPILVILGSDPRASFFVTSTAIWINNFVVLIMIFGSLINKVHASRRSRSVSTLEIERDIRKFAQNIRETQYTDSVNRIQAPSNASNAALSFVQITKYSPSQEWAIASELGDSASSLGPRSSRQFEGRRWCSAAEDSFQDTGTRSSTRTRSSTSLGLILEESTSTTAASFQEEANCTQSTLPMPNLAQEDSTSDKFEDENAREDGSTQMPHQHSPAECNPSSPWSEDSEVRLHDKDDRRRMHQRREEEMKHLQKDGVVHSTDKASTPSEVSVDREERLPGQSEEAMDLLKALQDTEPGGASVWQEKL